MEGEGVKKCQFSSDAINKQPLNYIVRRKTFDFVVLDIRYKTFRDF